MESRYPRRIAVGVIVSFVVISTFFCLPLSNDSYADSTSADRYYYNQMNNAGKALIDASCNLSPGEYSFQIDLNSIGATSSDILNALDQYLFVIHAEYPELYWLGKEVGGGAGGNTATINFNDGQHISATEAEVNQLNEFVDSLSVTGINRYERVKFIHDYLVGLLEYDDTDSDPIATRNVYNALIGNHSVVCEGYAKSFKLICDHFNIPCIIVSGQAKGAATSEGEGHMWNYVQMEDNKWYLVDCTWDDQASISYNYLLAGSNTMGMTTTEGPAITIGQSHTLRDDVGFEYPTLSTEKYSPPDYTLSFEVYGGDAVESIVGNEGDSITLPTPTYASHAFKGWYLTPECDGIKYEAGDSYTITGNVKFYASWVGIYTVTFQANGTIVKTCQFETITDVIDTPAIPERAGYTGVWESYTLSLENIVVNAIYTAIEYKATFIVDGTIIDVISFTMNDSFISEPEIPAKEGMIGSWSAYTISPHDLTITAEYREHSFSDDIGQFFQDPVNSIKTMDSLVFIGIIAGIVTIIGVAIVIRK